ncbi:MAG: hypothetical protein LUQ09_07720 [Methanomassiliicoccales archaeon]|nr:hypothetical protein [Methanomassiliicoccales archaeon]
MGYDNDDELNTREMYQQHAQDRMERRKPIGHVLYWRSSGGPIDGDSPIVVLSLINKDDLDDYLLTLSPFLRRLTKRPKIRWPPNDSNGRFIIVTESVMRDLEKEIIDQRWYAGKRRKENTKAVMVALFDFGEDRSNLVIILGLVPFRQSHELMQRLEEKGPRVAYQADWLSQDFVRSFEDWALGG